MPYMLSAPFVFLHVQCSQRRQCIWYAINETIAYTLGSNYMYLSTTLAGLGRTSIPAKPLVRLAPDYELIMFGYDH